MPRRKLIVAAVVCLPLVMSWLPLACAKRPFAPHPMATKAWIEIESQNFQAFSLLSESESISLIRQLELFRSVVASVSNVVHLEARVPTRFFIFDSEASFALFSRRGTLGLFTPGMRENTLTVAGHASELGFETRHIIQHEYAHFLVENHEGFNPPNWYNEGLAEFLATTREIDGIVEIGRVPLVRLTLLRTGQLTPLRQLLWARGFGPRGYSYAWALVHYLQVDRPREEPFSSQMMRYIALLDEGKGVPAAVEGAFSTSLLGLEREFAEFLAAGQFRFLKVPVDRFDVPSQFHARTVASHAIAKELGYVALSLGYENRATKLFRTALALSPDAAAGGGFGDARALTGLGRALDEAGDHAGGEDAFQRALTLAPDDALVLLDYANRLQERALELNNDEDRAALLLEARRFYVRSWEANDSVPETYAMYGKTYLATGQDANQGIDTLEHAHSMLPSNMQIRDLLARAYVALDRVGEAKPHLERLASSSHWAPAVEWAEAQLAKKFDRSGESMITEPGHPMNTALDQYSRNRPRRALAATTDDNKRWAWGISGKSDSVDAAAKDAIETCEANRRKSGIRSACRLFAEGDEIIWNDQLATSFDAGAADP